MPSHEEIKKIVSESFAFGYDSCLSDIKDLIGKDEFEKLKLGSNRGTPFVEVGSNTITTSGHIGEA